MTSLITLTTDFGTSDGYVGVMKGVIATLAAQSRVVDIAHDLPACDISGAAWVIANSYRYFPEGTVHVAIVDPGVGSSRRCLLLKTSRYYFLGPDNGLFTHILRADPEVECFELNRSQFWLPVVSTSFHGRDIFAPVAAHLTLGRSPDDMGEQIDAATLVTLPELPLAEERGQIKGAVAYVDRFGNLITNIPAPQLAAAHACRYQQTVIPIGATYSSVPEGGAVAYGGSHGFVEIAVSHGNAAEFLRAEVGEPVQLDLK